MNNKNETQGKQIKERLVGAWEGQKPSLRCKQEKGREQKRKNKQCWKGIQKEMKRSQLLVSSSVILPNFTHHKFILLFDQFISECPSSQSGLTVLHFFSSDQKIIRQQAIQITIPSNLQCAQWKCIPSWLLKCQTRNLQFLSKFLGILGHRFQTEYLA